MQSKNTVFFDMVMSIDGFSSPEGMELSHAKEPEYKQWQKKWMELMGWVFPQQFFRENLKIGSGGETGVDNEILKKTYNRTGVSIMGNTMFSLGEQMWPEEAPFHTPVFVLTDIKRDPWVRPGGTTFYFVNDGIESALKQARKVAGDKDIRISGGANTVQQYLAAGLVDEFTIHYSPVFFGAGTPLFLNAGKDLKIHIKDNIVSKNITHVTYQVEK